MKHALQKVYLIPYSMVSLQATVKNNLVSCETINFLSKLHRSVENGKHSTNDVGAREMEQIL